MGGAKNVKADKIRNDIVDATLAAYATYFQVKNSSAGLALEQGDPTVIVFNNTAVASVLVRRAPSHDQAKYGLAVDRRHFPAPKHAERVGKRPAQRRGDLAGDAHRQRANVLMLDWKSERPFLPENRELLACFLGAAISLDRDPRALPCADVVTGEIMQSDAETYGSHVAADFETAIATLKTLAHTLKER